MIVDGNEDLVKVIRQQTEKKMEDMMQAKRARNVEPINAHTPSTPMPSNYDIAQTYILLEILELLDSIDSRLISLETAIENRR